MKKIATAVLLATSVLSVLSIAGNRSYEILLAAPTQAGRLTLMPGQYRVMVDGSVAVFQNVRSTQSFRTPVKVEDTGAAYDVTRISTSKNAGAERMDAIEFEG